MKRERASRIVPRRTLSTVEHGGAYMMKTVLNKDIARDIESMVLD